LNAYLASSAFPDNAKEPGRSPALVPATNVAEHGGAYYQKSGGGDVIVYF
jgi:hypothetical protein